MTAQNYVSSLISEAIEAKGWSVHQFAKEADIAVTTAYRWVRGQSTPDPAAWPQLEELLDLSEESLLEAKQADIAAEYKATKERQRELLNSVAKHFQKQRTHFNDWAAFYAYYLNGPIGQQEIANQLGESEDTVRQWVNEGEAPPKRHWAAIEEHFDLPSGTLESINPKRQSRVFVDPNRIAAHGTLRDEDRPALADMLQQVLEQQAQIVKRLDELDTDK